MMEIKYQDIKINATDGIEVKAYLAQPQKEGRYPGILLIHEIWGLNDQIRNIARKYAQEGYVVLSPHLFSRYGKKLTENNIRKAMEPLFKLPPEQRRNPEALKNFMKTHSDEENEIIKILFLERSSMMLKMSMDVKACFDFLQSNDSTNGMKLGVTGYCMGGGLAFQVATQLPFSAAFIFYGANPEPLESVSNLYGPVFAVYAGEDKMVDAGIGKLVHAMLDAKKTLGLKIYEKTQHGFFNETSSLYDPKAAADAWYLAIRHFAKYLKQE